MRRWLLAAAVAAAIVGGLATGTATADPAAPVETTVAMPPATLGARGVGLSGPIGATVEGTTATGTVQQWWTPDLGLGWPDLEHVATAVAVVGGVVAVLGVALLVLAAPVAKR